jgi:curved DNA-binding protein CbpA
MSLADFFCGCCIDDGDGYEEYSRGRGGTNRHRRHHSKHGGYYKYSQGERDANRTRSHPQSRRSNPPSSHKMSERLSSSSDRTRSESRRNDESPKDEQTNSALSSRRRDDASVMAASLSETYQGYLKEAADEYMDEQSAIRRSLKDMKRPRRKTDEHQKQYQSEPEEISSSVKKSKLETLIEEKGQSQSQPRSRRNEDEFENVTTISKASLNPYRVLGLRKGASPREVYDSYKRKQKETHPNAAGGSEKAFHDVGNAYRRLRAELKRQEARKERRKSRLEPNGHMGTDSNEYRSKKQSTKEKSSKSPKRRRTSRQTHQNSDAEEEDNIDRRRVSIDERLKDHRALVHNLFANDAKEQAHKMSSSSSVSSAGHVTTLQKAIYQQSRALISMCLVPIEAGAVNINEQKKKIQNSCFYLSLAASYLSGAGAFETDPTAGYFLSSTGKNLTSDCSVTSSRTLDMPIATLPSAEKSLTMSLALQLKRAIEASGKLPCSLLCGAT